MGLEVQTSKPELARLLAVHPEVSRVTMAGDSLISWSQGNWRRELRDDRPEWPDSGLVELCDNNPMVCADRFSVSDLEGTLALIGLGPLLSAVVPVADPVVMFSFEPSGRDLARWLHTVGYAGGVTVAHDSQELDGVVAAICMLEIPAPSDPGELDEIFAERYSRSFYVRRTGPENWKTEAVLGRPIALYRLRYTPDTETGLVTVQVMLDRNGKGGAAQAIHAFNVMCGYEESLGVPDRFPS